MSDNRGGIVGSRMIRAPRPATERTGPDPTLLEGIGAAFRTAKDEQEDTQYARLSQSYRDIEDTLVDLGTPRERLRTPAPGQFMRSVNPGMDADGNLDFERVWGEVEAARTANPRAFATLPKTREEFERGVLTRQGARAVDQGVVARGGWTAALAGGAAAGVTDPQTALGNLAGGPGKSLAVKLLSEVAVNMGLEALQTPSLASGRKAMGETLTTEEAALNIGIAGVAVPALHIGGKLAAGVAGRVGKAIAPQVERTIAGVWDRLPPAVRTRWGSAAEIGEDDLPELAELAIGRENMSDDEKAAALVIRRETDIERASPFVPNGAGVKAHEDALTAAMARILSPAPAPSPRARLSSGTAIAGGTVATRPAQGTVDKVFASLVQQESGGRPGISGPPTAYGTAHGLTQMLDSTAAAVARRIGEPWQPALMRGTSEQAAAYQRKLGRAYFEEGLARYGGDVRQALHFYHGGPNQKLWGVKTRGYADKVLARAGSGDVRVAVPEGVGEVPELARAQAELDRLHAEKFELEQASRANDPEDAPYAPETVPLADVAIADSDLIPARLEAPDGVPAEVAMALPRLREIVADRRRSINDVGGIATELGVPEAQVRTALQRLAMDGEIRAKLVKSRNGDGTVAQQYARMPRDIGPTDALKFIARMGVSDAEQHRLGRGGRDLNKYVPGAGPLVRKSGKSVDAVGEALWEAGYFGPHSAVARPSEDDVLQFIERAATGDKIYAHGIDAPDAAGDGRYLDPTERAQLQATFGDAAREFDVNIEDDGLLRAAMARMNDPDAPNMTPRDAILAAVHDEWDALRLDVWHERDHGPEAEFDDGLDEAFHAASGSGAGVGGRSDAFPGDAPAGGTLRQDGSRADDVILSPEARAAFQDPDGTAAAAQVDSLLHDARASLDRGTEVDPAIAEKQRQQAQLGAEAPMRARTDQDSTMGSPLFDAADQPRFRLDDGDAPEKTMAEILADLDAEEATNKIVRDCL